MSSKEPLRCIIYLLKRQISVHREYVVFSIVQILQDQKEVN